MSTKTIPQLVAVPTLDTGALVEISQSGVTYKATILEALQIIPLPDGTIFVGNASAIATSVSMSGDTTISNTGVVTIANLAITNAKVSATAGIVFSKMAALTASRALATDISGFIVVSAVTATELGYVSGVTSAIQTQLTAKLTSTLASTNVFVGNVSNVATAVAISGAFTLSNAGVATLASAVVGISNLSATGTPSATTYLRGDNTWATVAGGATPLTTKGDLYGFSTVDARIPVGTNNFVLVADSVQALGLKWAAITNAMIDASAAIDFSKLAALTSANILVGNVSNVAASVAVSGDITLSNAGVVAIATGVIVNADISASAAIDFSKLAALTSANILVGNVSNVAVSVAVTGDVTISNAGVTTIGAAKVTNAMLAGSIALSNLSAVTASRVLASDASGFVSASTVTATTLAFLDATSSIQTQLDARATLTTAQTFSSGAKTFNDQILKIRNPADTFSYTIVASAITADRSLTLPLITGTDTLVTLGLAQTFSASISFSSNLIINNAGSFQLFNPAGTFKYTMTPAAILADRILNYPLITGTDTLATLGLAQTFTGILTFNLGAAYPDGAAIIDANNNEILKILKTASAVNEFTIQNGATGTNPQIQATGGDTNIGAQFVPKGTGTFYGVRENLSWPLTDEGTLPVVGVVYTTEPIPYDMTIEDVIAGLTVAGTGVALWTVDILKENSVNANAFTTIFTTKPTIDASEFTSTTAATPMILSVTTLEKGRRLQLKINTLDTNTLARGAKVTILAHATAR